MKNAHSGPLCKKKWAVDGPMLGCWLGGPHSLNIVSSETAWPIKVKFHLAPPWYGGIKVCLNDPGQWPMWPPCPYMVKTFKELFSGIKRPMTLNVDLLHRVLEYYQVCSNDDPGLTLTYFTARSNLVPYAFVWEKGKTMDFAETIVVYDLKLATDDRSDKKFLLASKLCPLGAVCPLPRGYIHVLNHEKKMSKIRLQRDFCETCIKWVKWSGISDDIKVLSPGDCLPLFRGYIQVLNHKNIL